MSINDAALPTADRAETLTLPSWQAELRAAVRDPAELERLLELPAGALGLPAGTAFPLLVPRSLVIPQLSEGHVEVAWTLVEDQFPTLGFALETSEIPCVLAWSEI